MQRVSTKSQPAKSLPIMPSDHYAQIRLFVTLALANHSSITPRAVHLPALAWEAQLLQPSKPLPMSPIAAYNPHREIASG
jgi:hypothetical protein